MVDTNDLKKEELIENLWLTDELINEIKILNSEVSKKTQNLNTTISTVQKEYLDELTTKFYDSEEYKAYQAYEDLKGKINDFKGVAVLLDLIISILLAYGLIITHVSFVVIIITFLVSVVAFYCLYFFGSRYLLKDKQPAVTPDLNVVLEEAKMSYEYQQMSNSLIANHLRREIKGLNDQIVTLEATIEQKSVLPEIYRERAREVIWYLENLMADNLKEALLALQAEDHRKKMQQTIEKQNEEINELKQTVNELTSMNYKMKTILEHQQQEITELGKHHKK